MRVLAKFLGFLEFLPYRTPSPDSLLPARAMVSSTEEAVVFKFLPRVCMKHGEKNESDLLPLN